MSIAAEARQRPHSKNRRWDIDRATLAHLKSRPRELGKIQGMEQCSILAFQVPMFSRTSAACARPSSSFDEGLEARSVED